MLDLRFAAALDRGKPVLIIDGWVEYPYSQTNFAAWQAGETYHPPTLEARAPNGEWQVLYKEFGYPAGMPRRMSVPLRGLPAGATELRLRTNMEVYWDYIAVAFAEPQPAALRRELPLVKASLGQPGFAKRTTGPQRLPHYDAQRAGPLWDTRHQAGFYTELGEMTPLVSATDDAFAIFGPGEAVFLEYHAPAEVLADGWHRVLVLEATGWCKDMDLYTKDGETIGPLPGTGKPAEVRDRLHQQFNTRYQSGH